MMESVIRNFTLSWKQLLGFGIVIALAGGIEWGVEAIIHANTTVARNVECTTKSFGHDGGVVMMLDCGGVEDSTNNATFIASYLQEPKPFTCTRYNWAYADCTFKKS